MPSLHFGGELEFSKVLRAGFLPPPSIVLLTSLECQGLRGVWGEKNGGEPCGYTGELTTGRACVLTESACANSPQSGCCGFLAVDVVQGKKFPQRTL